MVTANLKARHCWPAVPGGELGGKDSGGLSLPAILIKIHLLTAPGLAAQPSVSLALRDAFCGWSQLSPKGAKTILGLCLGATRTPDPVLCTQRGLREVPHLSGRSNSCCKTRGALLDRSEITPKAAPGGYRAMQDMPQAALEGQDNPWSLWHHQLGHGAGICLGRAEPALGRGIGAAEDVTGRAEK